MKSAKRLKRHLGKLRSGWRNSTLTCPCCRSHLKSRKRVGNRAERTPIRARQ